ncbi:MAG: amidohydrolase [Deltaproteobacteria bacterium]|nr:amidohydrolase [Deltaproteobacteria bacterium]
MHPFDIVIKNGAVLTMDKQGTVIRDGVVGISEDHISFVGRNNGDYINAEKIIDAQDGIILPGLINGHTHAAMTLFRGLADDLPLMEWLNNHIFPAESRINSDFVFTGTLLACAEMILSGTTTFCDMYLFEDEAARACKAAGMRSLMGEVLYDFSSPCYGSIEKGFIYTESLIKKWRDDPLISIAVEPHSLFTCSPDLLVTANKLALKNHVPLIIHLSETEEEIRYVEKNYGKRPVHHLDSLGILGPHVIACHCVHLDRDEIGILKNRGIKVIHNPESNMKLASGVAPVHEMVSSGITVGLGTDGCASNNDLDLFGEMDTAAKLQKIKEMDPTVMDAETVLRMATIEGAKALGLENITGSIETGKRADIIVVDINRPHLTPMYNPCSHLVYSAKGSDVIHSIINGRLVMSERSLFTIDLKDVLEKASAIAEDIKLYRKD